MSLYHEAAQILDISIAESASIKTIVFGKKDWKSSAKTLYALTIEAAKWSQVLSEVIDHSGVLSIEKQLTPSLSLVLVHDLLLAKKGIALPSNHGLHSSAARHKARLNAELTKARLRRGASTIEQLRLKLDQDSAGSTVSSTHPRWVRINTILTTVETQLKTTFSDYTVVESLGPIVSSAGDVVYIDEHIPDLLAVPSSTELTTSKAYKQGHIILQDKASCFPAYMLGCRADEGVMIDACAAPGNKTTHLAAIAHSVLSRQTIKPYITACEKDSQRSQTLERMVKTAGAGEIVEIKQSQNFLKLDPNAKENANVTALLLDPSCSGSGIVGRGDRSVTIQLPAQAMPTSKQIESRGKKRKQIDVEEAGSEQEEQATTISDPEKLRSRLAALSEFQLRLLQHAMQFPAATRITYSTCSIHAEENEIVVIKALESEVAQQRGWHILRREDQVTGMRKWLRRGDLKATQALMPAENNGITAEILADACIRCEKSTEDGTMGFFVAGFVRSPWYTTTRADDANKDDANNDDWGGFGD